MKTKLTFAMFIALFFLLSLTPPSYAKDKKLKKQHIHDLECTTGEVAKMQADETWACEADAVTDLDKDGIEALVGTHTVDTSAATECGLGEVYISDGSGGGVCLPLATLLGGPQDTAASACPCSFLRAINPRHSWFDSTISCSTTPPTNCDEGTCEITLEDEDNGGVDHLSIIQVGQFTSNPTLCYQFINGGGVFGHYQYDIVDGQELNDCIKDLQTVAIALGVSCPATPNFVPPN